MALAARIPGGGKALREDGRDDVAGDVGQAEMAALVFEGQPRVVDPQAMKHRGVQVVHVDGIVDDVVAIVVGLAVDVMPGLMPPPASHMVKQRGWWSRP